MHAWRFPGAVVLLQNGEDVRQDQLAVHMVSLMDRQLKEAGLDLKLKVLATRVVVTMVEEVVCEHCGGPRLFTFLVFAISPMVYNVVSGATIR